MNKKNVLQRQREINNLRRTNPGVTIQDITLKEIVGRKIRPVEGIEFKRLVKSGTLENIEWIGQKSNKSQIYNIS